MKLNSDGELLENTMIFEDGSVVFIDEHRMSEDERETLDDAIDFVTHLDKKYGSIDVFDLMDANITKKEMFKYLCAMRLLYKHGLIGGIERE